MNTDLPDDWFRPRDRDPHDRADGEAGVVDSGHTDSDPTDSGGTAQVEPADVEQTIERYTTQFKPGQLHRRDVAPSLDDPVPITEVITEPEGPVVPARRHSSWLGRYRIAVVVVALALALGVGLGAGQLVRQWDDARSESDPSLAPDSASASPSSGQSSAQAPWQGQTKPVKASQVTATCTAPSATDADGKTVSYAAANVADDTAATAWRCNGDGIGQSLVFTFPAGTELVGVGLVNGYAKTAGSVALYDEYRRITRVRWSLADGAYFSQSLSENNTGIQQVLIPPVRVDGPVQLTIETSSAPGKVGEPTRDAVLISSVVFLVKG